MVDTVMVSTQGVCFTSETVAVMCKFSEVLRQDNLLALCWSVCFGEHGQIVIGLVGDYEPQPLAIEDQVEDVVFYWYADLPGLEAVRNYCVDAGWERATRLISHTVTKDST